MENMKFMRKLSEKEGKTKEGIYIDPNLIIPEFKEFSEIIDCKICSGIVTDPVCCKSCDSIFCKKCINSWISRSIGKCPNRCNFQEFAIRRTTINLMNKIKIYCINRENGCKEEIFYEDYFKHLESKCDYEKYECIACGEIDKKLALQSHILKCPKMNVNCEFCFEKFFFNEIEQHHEKCQMYELSCKQCNIKVKRYNYERHLDLECKEGIIECSYCGTKNKRKNENLHTKQICFDIFKKKLLDQYENNNKNTNNNLLVEKLTKENNLLKQQINKKEMTIKNLSDELNKYQGNKNNINTKNDFGNFFKNVGNDIKDNINNIFKK